MRTRCRWTITFMMSTSRCCREYLVLECRLFYSLTSFLLDSLYWSEQDVLSFLSSNSDDAHLKRIKAWHERSLTATHTSADDENAAPENVDGPVSIQRDKSEKKGQLEFGGLRRSGGHRIQDVKEMDTIPVSRSVCDVRNQILIWWMVWRSLSVPISRRVHRLSLFML